MTIKELESKLQKIDPNLEILKDSYMKSEVLVMKPNLLAVKGQYFIYDFFNKKFIRNGILKWLNDNDTFAFDKMQSLLNRYWYGSKPVLSGLYTTKEVDSILRWQPKMKRKEQIKRDFIDYLLDQGIGYKVHTSQSNIEQIKIENEAYDTICSINFFNDEVNQVWLYKVGRVDKKQLETILGLYEQILEMMEELMRLKEDDNEH